MPLNAIMNRFLNQSVASIHPPLSPTNNNQYYTYSYDVHKSNFSWFGYNGDAAGNGPPRTIGHNYYRRYVQLSQLSSLFPFGMMIIILTVIFILIIFRRWAGLVAGIVAGCLTSISIYLLFLTLKEPRLVYE